MAGRTHTLTEAERRPRSAPEAVESRGRASAALVSLPSRAVECGSHPQPAPPFRVQFPKLWFRKQWHGSSFFLKSGGELSTPIWVGHPELCDTSMYFNQGGDAFQSGRRCLTIKATSISRNCITYVQSLDNPGFLNLMRTRVQRSENGACVLLLLGIDIGMLERTTEQHELARPNKRNNSIVQFNCGRYT